MVEKKTMSPFNNRQAAAGDGRRNLYEQHLPILIFLL